MKQYISFMDERCFCPLQKRVILKKGEITKCGQLDDFWSMAEFVVDNLKSCDKEKLDVKGWIPSLFDYHNHPTNPAKGYGLWRTALGEIDSLSCLIGDIDNDRPKGTGYLTIGDIQSNLKALGNPNAFYYTTFNSKPDAVRFRFAIEINRYINRSEFRKVMAYLNKICLKYQNDMTMCDRAHYSIAPTFNATIDYNEGCGGLDVDMIIDLADKLSATDPVFKQECINRAEFDPKDKSSVAKYYSNFKSKTIDFAMGNPNAIEWVSKSDLAQYQSSNKGHWQEMRTLLIKIMFRSGCTLTAGDLSYIYSYIDDEAGGYQQKLNRDRNSRIIDAINYCGNDKGSIYRTVKNWKVKNV
jgi:hypothetical protein